MEGGYLLAHVLEVVVPSYDLGESPCCEVVLGEQQVQFPIPSTLRSENIALATGGRADPVVQVLAFDSRRRHVGLVVVPVSTLVPLEVWNVWYAMDDAEEESEERPEEETPKMHLLLQYVSAEAAASETPQLREMRAQDFLLRALQQLNASLEAKVEELIRARTEPYERVISAMEEKQRFYDDQEDRMRALMRSLEEQEQKQRALYAQLHEASKKCQLQVDAEQEVTRQALVAKADLERRLVELEQEVALRRAHEDSLQKRVTLMETERSVVVHQKCLLVDNLEEEAQNSKKEIERQKELRYLLQGQLQEQAEELAKAQQEVWQLREERGKELEKVHAWAADAARRADVAERELNGCRDIARDKATEGLLQAERLAELSRRLEVLGEEASSYRAMFERERTRRQELEKKLEEQELQSLHAALQEQTQTIAKLRDEATGTSQELRDEQSRALSLSTELATTKKELVEGRKQAEELRRRIASQDELREDARKAEERCEELKQQVKLMAQEAQQAAERCERELAETAKTERLLCEERDERQKEVCDLKTSLSQLQLKVEEATMLKEQSARSLAAAREGDDFVEALRRELQQAHEELGGLRTGRTDLQADLEHLMAKFREDAFAKDKRYGELEGLLEDRSKEIKVLMYRVQELSSRYVPAKGDSTDAVLAKWIHGYRPAVPFFRLSQGVYLFGRRQVICKISNDKPVFRVGGGFVGFDKFLELYASEELERLLSYDLDERTGEPKFVEAQKARQALEDSGALEEFRERAEQLAARGGSRSPGGAPRSGSLSGPILHDRRRTGLAGPHAQVLAS